MFSPGGSATSMHTPGSAGLVSGLLGGLAKDLARESAGGLVQLATDVSSGVRKATAKTTKGVEEVTRAFAAESLEGLAALAQDSTAAAAPLAGAVKDVVKVAAVVGEMVAADALSAADVVGGEGVSSGLRAAGADARAAGELAASIAATNLAATSQVAAASIVGGIRDNVQLLDSVSRSTVETMQTIVERSEWGGGGDGSAVDEESIARPSSPSPPPVRPFEAWLDEFGGGGVMLQSLEGVKDGCALKVRAKLSKLAPSQRAALKDALGALEAQVSADTATGGAAADDEDDMEGTDEASGPPTDRLSVHSAAAAELAVEAALARADGLAAEAVSAISRTLGEGNDDSAAGSVACKAASGVAEEEGEEGGGDVSGGADGNVPSEGELLRDAVDHLGALSTRTLAKLSTECLRALGEYAARCRLEADRPSTSEPGAVLEGVPWVHGLDWPFVSELERARWKAVCLRRAGVRLTRLVHLTASRLGEAALQIRRELPAAGLSTGASLTGSPNGTHSGAIAAGVAAEDAAAMRLRLKGMSTALRLDAAAATEMVQEAVQLCAPVLCYVALGDC